MKKEKSCGCIVIEKDKVLLIKSTEGIWDFPKGHIEKDETEVETAIREVKEETNVDVKPDTTKKYINHYITGTGIDKTVIYFKAQKLGGKEKTQIGETQEVKWFNFKDALEIITYDDAKNILRNVLKDNII